MFLVVILISMLMMTLSLLCFLNITSSVNFTQYVCRQTNDRVLTLDLGVNMSSVLLLDMTTLYGNILLSLSKSTALTSEQNFFILGQFLLRIPSKPWRQNRDPGLRVPANTALYWFPSGSHQACGKES